MEKCYSISPGEHEEISAQLSASGPHQVSLQGWDTASILTMGGMNKIIAAQKPKYPDLNASSKFSGSITDGVWESWDMIPDKRFVGGVIRFACKLKSGKATDVLGGKYDLAGAMIYITVSLKSEKMLQHQLKDKTADPSQPGETYGLKTVKKEVNHIAAVTVDEIVPKSLSDPFIGMIGKWFDANMTAFDPVLHYALLNEKAAKGDFQWLKPTLLSYASLTDAAGKGYFAALCKTDAKKNKSWNKLANQIDAAVADDWPSGVNSIFAISGERFAQKFLMKGALHTFEDHNAGDFEVVGDQLIVTNNKTVTWKKFKMADGTIINPCIPKGGFSLSVEEDRLKLEFTGVTWSHPLFIGNDIFHLNFTQYVHLKLSTNSSGQPVLVTSNDYKGQKKKKGVPDVRDCHISVVPDKTARDAEKAMQWIGMIASVLSLGTFAAGKWAVWGAEAAEAASNVSNWIATGDAALNVAVDAGDAVDAIDQAVSNSGNLAAAAANTTGAAPMLAEYSTYLFRFSMLTGIVSAISGIYWGIQAIEMSNDLDIDTDKVPALDDFLDNVLGAEQWPGVKGWVLKDVRLAQSLLLFGERTF